MGITEGYNEAAEQGLTHRLPAGQELQDALNLRRRVGGRRVFFRRALGRLGLSVTVALAHGIRRGGRASIDLPRTWNCRPKDGPRVGEFRACPDHL